VVGTAIERATAAAGSTNFDNQRIHGMWLPAIELIKEGPWYGHGFGRAAWDAAFVAGVPNHPAWTVRTPLGGPHNLWLQVGFVGGVLGLAAFLAAAASIVVCLWRQARSHGTHSATAVAVLSAVVGFYGVRGLVEDPRWEPLGLVLLWTVLLERGALSRSKRHALHTDEA
jgi:O-antigen ligase